MKKNRNKKREQNEVDGEGEEQDGEYGSVEGRGGLGRRKIK